MTSKNTCRDGSPNCYVYTKGQGGVDGNLHLLCGGGTTFGTQQRVVDFLHEVCFVDHRIYFTLTATTFYDSRNTSADEALYTIYYRTNTKYCILYTTNCILYYILTP